MYQYRSPGEWFAEFYTAINDASPTVRGKAKSAYPGATSWFDGKGLLVYPT